MFTQPSDFGDRLSVTFSNAACAAFNRPVTAANAVVVPALQSSFRSSISAVRRRAPAGRTSTETWCDRDNYVGHVREFLLTLRETP